MNRQVWLKAGNHLFGWEELKQGHLVTSFTEQEKNVVQFCSHWLNGKSEFEFQTSGSTGSPKKITFTREQLIASAQLTAGVLQLKPGFTALICLDVNFIAGAMMLVRSLLTGMNMIVTTPSSNPLESVSDEIDFAALVPLQFTMLVKHEKEKLNKLKTIIIGGAPLEEDSFMQWQHLSPALYATYGMTETITHIALQKLNGADRQDFFQLLPGIEGSTDDRGCLVIRATHLGPQPVVTNDLVTLLDKTHFRWIGRVDRIINSGGIKIPVEKIEKITGTILEDLNIKRRFFAAGIPDDKLGEKLVLVVEGDLSSESESDIRKAFSQRLSKYETPQLIFQVSQFLQTSTQKIDRIGTLKLLKVN